MNFFTVTLFLALGVTAFGEATPPTLEDLKAALDTNDEIWLALRSYELEINGEEQKCNYVMKMPMKNDEYHFLQHFKCGANSGKKDLYVRIEEATGSELNLTVINKTGFSVPYTMQFWDENHHCFVLTFKENDQVQCELHVWEQDVDKLYPKFGQSCMERYGKLCDKKKHQLYSPECRKR
uniref:Uncharacterized protein n=1 Tax=Amblyomma americanum TaxID=6943 RepID=A0A0C9SFB1_AMBAM